MNRITQLLCVSAAMLLVNNVSAMPQPEGNFLGINLSKEHCRMQVEDGDEDGDFDFEYRGEGKVKYTKNKNYILATCKAEYLQVEDGEGGDDTVEQAIVERDDIKCMIAEENTPGTKPHMIHYVGVGGFTVTPNGQVIGRCKYEK